MNELTKMLDDEIKLNKKETWNKLDKTIKLFKLKNFAILYCTKNQINIDEDNDDNILFDFLKLKLEQRRLINTKDVTYDIEKMVITDIPGLSYVNNEYNLARNTKRVSTIKSLNSNKKHKHNK